MYRLCSPELLTTVKTACPQIPSLDLSVPLCFTHWLGQLGHFAWSSSLPQCAWTRGGALGNLIWLPGWAPLLSCAAGPLCADWRPITALPIPRTVHFTNRHYTDNALDYKAVKYWWTILWQLQKKIFFHLFSVSWSWIKPFWKNVSDWREEKERKLSKQIIKIINPSNRTQKNILVVQHIKWYCFFWQLFWWLSERNYVFSKIMSSLQNNG